MDVEWLNRFAEQSSHWSARFQVKVGSHIVHGLKLPQVQLEYLGHQLENTLGVAKLVRVDDLHLVRSVSPHHLSSHLHPTPQCPPRYILKHDTKERALVDQRIHSLQGR